MPLFDGNVTSDFMKLIRVQEEKKIDFIDFAATDFYELKSALISYMKAVYPEDYKNFAESDLGVMLVELVSYMGAILSMKADMLANENFLATAKQRESVRKLLELIGVSLKGPASAAANALLTLTGSPVTGAITIPITERVRTITSPEDGAPLNYTIYKVTNGRIDDVNFGGTVELHTDESDNPGVDTIYSNLALLEGALVTQSGTISNSLNSREITLTESPVIDGSVDVFIDSTDLTVSGSWRQVENLYMASGINDNIYQVVYNKDYAATVIFGDGIVGRTPPVGASYFVLYRVGGGERGNLASEIINAPVIVTDSDETQYLCSIENTSMATGGAEAESLDHAKRYAPLTFKQQNRLVTLEDFKAHANRFISSAGGTGKALAATRKAFSSGNIIDLYVLEKASTYQLQKATPTYKEDLLQSMASLLMITDEVIIVDGLIRTIDLVLSVRIDKALSAKEEEIKQKVKNTTLRFFNVDNNDFGKTFVLGDLSREIFKIAEVRFASVDNFKDDVQVEFNEIIQLNNLQISIELV